MKLLAALFLTCIVGLNQWKADRTVTNCDGSPATDVAEYSLERMIATAFPISCEFCCDQTCQSMCGSTCYSYSWSTWNELERQPEPGTGADVCFAWDSSDAGQPEGSTFPGPDEVWFIRSRNWDAAGNLGVDSCP